MTSVVLDASAAIAWLRHEPRPGWLDDLFDDALSGSTLLVSPTLFWLELGNALAGDRRLTDAQAIEGLLRLESVGIETVEEDRPLRLHGLQLAREHRLTMYDATYLALASSIDVPLATLDQRLGQAAASLGRSYAGGPSMTREPLARYGDGPETTSLAALGAALAELRERHAHT